MYIGTASDDEPNDQYVTPAVLRSRQDAAYCSIVALQLRVEELTLEVTKVNENEFSNKTCVTTYWIEEIF